MRSKLPPLLLYLKIIKAISKLKPAVWHDFTNSRFGVTTRSAVDDVELSMTSRQHIGQVTADKELRLRETQTKNGGGCWQFKDRV